MYIINCKTNDEVIFLIYFDEKRLVFHLQGNCFSYQMKIVDGVLMHMYWGSRLPSCDGDCLFTLAGEAASFDLPFNRRPREVPTQKRAISAAVRWIL